MKAKHIATFFAAALLTAACADTPAAPLAVPGDARFEEGGNSMGSGNATGGTSDGGIFGGSGNVTGGNSMGSGNDVTSTAGGEVGTDSTQTERGGNSMGSGN